MTRFSIQVLLVTSIVAGTVGYLAGRHMALRSVAESTVGPSVSVSPMTATPLSEPAKDSLAASDPAARWRRLTHEPLRSPQAEREMAAALAELASHDPARAIALAMHESNLLIRARLRDAVLRAWAEHDSTGAARWARDLPEADRIVALSAVLGGATRRSPGEAAELGTRLCTDDPGHAADYGQALIEALVDTGDFSVAVRFVAGSAATPLRAEQTNATFQLWAEHQPREAAAAVDAIGDPQLRAEAFRGMAVGWAMADPVSLADYAAGLAPGDLRAQALANALPRWIDQDPVAAAGWIALHDNSADFDLGVVAVAAQPALMADRPETAMSLAGTITDAALRANTLRNLALKWAERDPAAARKYVQSSAAFSVEERGSLVAEMGTTP